MSSNSIVTMNLSDMDSVNMTHVNQKKPVVAAADKQQLVYSAKIDEKKKKMIMSVSTNAVILI